MRKDKKRLSGEMVVFEKSLRSFKVLLNGQIDCGKKIKGVLSKFVLLFI